MRFNRINLLTALPVDDDARPHRLPARLPVRHRWDGGTKGLAIRAELEGYYASDINHGRLYPNLDELVEKDLVEKGKNDDRTNSYELTEEGEEIVINRRKWEDEMAEMA